MSEQVKERESLEDSSNSRRLSEPIAELLREIQQTPREYWPNLLQMIRLFRETVTMKPGAVDYAKAIDVTKLSKEEMIERNKAAIELINSWVDEGDEQEQTETAEYLRQALEENPISI